MPVVLNQRNVHGVHQLPVVIFLSGCGRCVCFCWQALRLKPDYPKVVLRKARLHARLEEWDIAIEVRRAVAATIYRGVSCQGRDTGTKRAWDSSFEVRARFRTDADSLTLLYSFVLEKHGC